MPEAVALAVRITRRYALRAVRETREWTMWRIHKADGFNQPRSYFHNKGDGVEPSKLKHMRDEDWVWELDYIDGVRRALDPRGRGLEYLREVSQRAAMGDKAAEAELRAAPRQCCW